MRTFIFSALLILSSLPLAAQEYLEIWNKDSILIDRALKPKFLYKICLNPFDMTKTNKYESDELSVIYDVKKTDPDARKKRRTFAIYYSELHPFLGELELYKQGLVIESINIKLENEGWYTLATVNEINSEITIFKFNGKTIQEHSSQIGKIEDVMLFYNLGNQ